MGPSHLYILVFQCGYVNVWMRVSQTLVDEFTIAMKIKVMNLDENIPNTHDWNNDKPYEGDLQILNGK